MSAPAELVAALPQYDIGAEIGEGGMGLVFAGTHRTLGRSVAIKQLPWDVLNHAASSELFDREARVLASLDHPHIVPVYDYVRTGREHLLVMERLDGGTVHSRFHGGGVSGEQACAIGLAMLAGLHAAHRAGVLHLDVKPRNLLFTLQGVMKVADFGIARVISEGATLVTHGGEILGTPAYIAPEQAMGNALSPAADVYAAGTVLYELLSRQLPFDNTRGAISMMRQHMFTDPRPIAGVPMPIAGVIMRSLARELDARYREAESFAADLAGAATAVYGPGWLERSGVPVLHLTPRVIAGLNSPTAPGPIRRRRGRRGRGRSGGRRGRTRRWSRRAGRRTAGRLSEWRATAPARSTPDRTRRVARRPRCCGCGWPRRRPRSCWSCSRCSTRSGCRTRHRRRCCSAPSPSRRRSKWTSASR
jgi:serine/threonine-protein kinase